MSAVSAVLRMPHMYGPVETTTTCDPLRGKEKGAEPLFGMTPHPNTPGTASLYGEMLAASLLVRTGRNRDMSFEFERSRWLAEGLEYLAGNRGLGIHGVFRLAADPCQQRGTFKFP